MTFEGRPRPRVVDKNPVGHRADSRRLARGGEPSVDDVVAAPTGLLARLEALTGQPRPNLFVGAAVFTVVILVGAIVGGRPSVERSQHFDEAAQQTLAATWAPPAGVARSPTPTSSPPR